MVPRLSYQSSPTHGHFAVCNGRNLQRKLRLILLSAPCGLVRPPINTFLRFSTVLLAMGAWSTYVTVRCGQAVPLTPPFKWYYWIRSMWCFGRAENSVEEWPKLVALIVNVVSRLKCRLQANYKAYCYEMKVMQAISWALFCLFVIAFYILMQLVTLAQQFGRYRIWSEPIRGENCCSWIPHHVDFSIPRTPLVRRNARIL